MMRRRNESQRAARITASAIREVGRLCQRPGVINLAQGFPDFPAPDAIKEAATRAIRNDVNQYAITWGASALREALSDRYHARYGLTVDPETEITVCCGATEATVASILAIVDPGDEIVLFEPCYEAYLPALTLAGAIPRYVTLHEPEFRMDADELAAAFNERTRAILINTPGNPTGKVFTAEELAQIARLCQQWNVVAITDEIYELIVYDGHGYDGHRHIPIATLDSMKERTITISSLSKTYSVTGWRVGWALAAPPLSAAIRKVHDFLTVGAPAPLQEAGAAALRFPPDYYERVVEDYGTRRDILRNGLEAAGFHCARPEGAYYLMTDVSRFGFEDAMAFVRHMIERVGVGALPGASFYEHASTGAQTLRFAFCKREETLREAVSRLAVLTS